jgi:hypothetical protein
MSGVFVAGGFGDDAGQVVVAASGHGDVEVLGAGRAVDDEDRLVDCEPLAAVDGDGIREPDMLSDIVTRDRDRPSAFQGSQLHRPSLDSLFDGPAVTVSDPCAGAGDQAAVIAGGDDLVADTDGLVADGDACRLDLARVDSGCSGPHGQLVDGVTVGGHHHHRPTLIPGLPPGAVGVVEDLVTVAGSDSVPLGFGCTRR